MARNTVTINGVVTTFDGAGNISIAGGRIVVNGKDVTPESKEISISIQGDVSSLMADACSKINVSGSVGSIRTQSGDVECGDITVVVVIESDHDGNMRLREVPTAELTEVLRSGT
jgi:hypothetical protein